MINGDVGNGLSASVLVLNRYYMAVHVISARRAFCLLFRELAEVIHVEQGQYANYDFESWQLICEMRSSDKRLGEDWIQAVNFEIQVPRVVRLLHYDRIPRRTVRFNRRNLFARDEHTCQYCGTDYPPSQLSFDHVVPRSRGGKTTWENIVSCCFGCNSKKGGRTPQEARMKLIRAPKKPRHSPLLSMKLGQPKYESWRSFVQTAEASVAVT
jgi:5-methylcytosine-specific restriction endonuclease McrA